MSITGTPSRWRTSACSSLAVIWASLQTQHELDGASASLARDSRLVNHLLDQEQTPAAGLLAAFELRLQIRLLRLGELAGVASVGDLHAQAIGRAEHANRDRQIGPVLVAVLHRVHRGLRDRGLQPLQSRGLQADPGYRPLHEL